VKLPPLLVLTDRSLCGGPLRKAIAVAVDCGARAVVLREKDLPWDERMRLAGDLRALLDPVGGVLVLAGPRGDAVHLSASDSLPNHSPSLVGRSCHSPDEVIRAGNEHCDYVTVSPVFVTPSKPGYGPALGIDNLAALAAIAPPVYALGGVRPSDVAPCLAAGAYGVAVMGPIMRDPRAVGAYLTALQEVSV
jgi:thiamine-phosphate diphosphorylase